MHCIYLVTIFLTIQFLKKTKRKQKKTYDPPQELSLQNKNDFSMTINVIRISKIIEYIADVLFQSTPWKVEGCYFIPIPPPPPTFNLNWRNKGMLRSRRHDLVPQFSYQSLISTPHPPTHTHTFRTGPKTCAHCVIQSLVKPFTHTHTLRVYNFNFS